MNRYEHDAIAISIGLVDKDGFGHPDLFDTAFIVVVYWTIVDDARLVWC